MKRQTIFGALAALALAIVPFIAAQPAEAAVVTCTQVSSFSGYPTGQFTKFCTGTTIADGGSMRDAVPFGQKELYRGAVTYYFFLNPTDYNDSAVSLGLGTAEIVSPGDYGVTHFDSAHRPVYTAIFKNNSSAVANPNIKASTGVEVGKAMDYLLGYVMNGGAVLPDNVRMSSSSIARKLYQQQVETDYTAFNLLARCINGATFAGQKDSAGAYICDGPFGNLANLAPAYAALPECASPATACNRAVLKKAYPKAFSTYDGLFAEQISTNYVVQDNLAGRYAGGFKCSNAIQKVAFERGIIMSGTSIPTGCQTPTIGTICLKLWNGSGNFPDGNVLQCNGTVINWAPDIFNNLIKLGKNGVAGTPPIDTVLNVDKAYVYAFLNQASYDTLFVTQAGFTNSIDISTVNAGTYPVSPSASVPKIWYSILNGSSTEMGMDSGKGSYVAAHELGHTIDMNTAQPSASTNYKNAVQQDWKELDYVSWTSSSVNTFRNPCGILNQGGQTYTGPLTGVIDTSNGNALYCDAAGHVNSIYNFRGVGSPYQHVSDILRRRNISGFVITPEMSYDTGQKIFSSTTPSTIAQPGWRERFAGALAVQTFKEGGFTTIRPEMDGVVQNGYFGCIAGTGQPSNKIAGLTLKKGYAQYVYLGQAPAYPAGCTAAIGGWTDILN